MEAHSGGTDYAKSSLFAVTNESQQLMITMNNHLQGLGLSTEGIELPHIAVVGDQSSGKSSLVERVT